MFGLVRVGFRVSLVWAKDLSLGKFELESTKNDR